VSGDDGERGRSESRSGGRDASHTPDESRRNDAERERSTTERRERAREQRRDSRRPPRALQAAVGVGLGLVLSSVAALGIAVFVFGLAPGGVAAPGGEFGVEYDAPTETATVEYVGGERFTRANSGRLYVAVDDTTREELPLPVDEGDGTTVENVSAGQEVTVVWVAPDDGGERAVAARTVGETDEGARLASRRVG